MNHWLRKAMFPVMFLSWRRGRTWRLAWAMACAFAMRDDGDRKEPPNA